MKIAKYLFASAVIALASCAGNTAKTAEEAETAEPAQEVAAEEVVATDESVVELPAGSTEIAAADKPTIIDFNAEWCALPALQTHIPQSGREIQRSGYLYVGQHRLLP